MSNVQRTAVLLAILSSGCTSTYTYNGGAYRCDGSPAYGAEVLGIGSEWKILPFPIVAGVAKIDEYGKFEVTTDRRIHYFENGDEKINFNVENSAKLSYSNCK